jgi:hypothetical protein
MNDEELWKKRFKIFAAIRLIGVLTFTIGVVIAFSDLLRPGGWKSLGGILIVIGVIDAVVAPRLLKRSWDRRDP